jgi:hypothetical protein
MCRPICTVCSQSDRLSAWESVLATRKSGVGDQEVDALQVRLDHVVDGVAAGAADADDGNLGS